MTNNMKSLQGLFSLEGKTVFITGGAGHLGTAMCESLAELGANIVIGSRDKEKSSLIAKGLSEEFVVQVSGVELDITNPESIDEALFIIEKSPGSCIAVA